MPFRRMFRPVAPRAPSAAARRGAAALMFLLSFAAGAEPVLPYLLFFPAVIVGAVLLDRGSGLVAAILAAVLALYFFVSPARSFAVPDATTALSVALFVLTGLSVSVATEALRLAYRDAEEARRATEAALRRAEAGERERDLLLAEFGHRAKDDLARVSAALALQAAGASAETAAALRAAADRVRVVSRVHDRLAHGGGRVMVDAREFLRDLVADLRASAADLRPVELFVEAERHLLPVSRAGAVGLIADELVANALKHAFPGGRTGAVRLDFRREGPDYLLTVADGGVGLPAVPEEGDGAAPGEVVPRRGGDMGRRLVRALAAQLRGRVDTSPTGPAGGTTHLLRFPVRAPGDRGGGA